MSNAVHVWLFGGLSRLVAERPVVVTVPAEARAADVIAALCLRFGPPFTEAIMDSAREKIGICRLFLNGYPVEPDEPLPPAGGAEIELIVLTAAEGG